MRSLIVLLLALMLAGCAEDTSPAAMPATRELDEQEPGDPEEASVDDDPTTPKPKPKPKPQPEPQPGDPDGPSEDPDDDPVPQEPAPGREIIVAVLDTGIRPTHRTFKDGQIVAWHDFSQGSGIPDTLWDPSVDPYDDGGHGTAVASMVAGTAAQQSPSHAPGVKLAIGKISGPSGSAFTGDMARAIRWATQTVEADVISFSFYSYTPAINFGSDVLRAFQEARAAGTLPVVLAGNGMGNAGAPTISWLHGTPGSPDSLIVGGASDSGTPVAPLGSMDPEVTALYRPTVACFDDDNCYRAMSGTSFSTPLVAGMAARLLVEADKLGKELDPGDLEAILKGVARDTTYPPSLEGHGFLDAPELDAALQHVRDGTTPATDSTNQAHDDMVQRLRLAYQGRT